MSSEENTVSTGVYVERQFKYILGALINEKGKEDNKDVAREISIVITETEKAFAYFEKYVKPNLGE